VTARPPTAIRGSGCSHAVRGETEEDLLENAAEHAKEHGIVEVASELVEMVKANIEDG
jgi:predicted small metal-binding protein